MTMDPATSRPAAGRLAPAPAAGERSAGARVWWGDIALTAGLVIFGLASTGPATAEDAWAGSPTVDYLLVVAACLPIAVWRRRPLWTLAVTGTAVMVYLGLGTPHGPILVAGLIAVYAVASRCPARQVGVAFTGLLAAAVVAGMARTVNGGGWTDVASVVVVMGASAAVGVAVRVRRHAEDGMRAERARREVVQQRLEMAQEVHDVVGHGLTVIAMQAGAALHVMDHNPARVRESLEAIRAASTQALEDLRTELDAMRRHDGRAAPRRPASGAMQLTTLVERVRGGGLDVRLDDDATDADVPQPVARAVHRIVQEALTNVLRHAGPSAAAHVTVRRVADALVVDVVDTGTGGRRREGDGIRGMRARARALGGELEAGPRPAGGFRVQGRIPIAGPEA